MRWSFAKPNKSKLPNNVITIFDKLQAIYFTSAY